MLREVMENYYEMSPITKNTSFRALLQREEGLYRKMTEITDLASLDGRGWWLVRKFLRLTNSKITDVIGQTKGEEYKYLEVVKAIKFLFSNSISERKFEKIDETGR